MNDQTPIQTVPHSIEIEQQIIGALLCNNDRFGAIAGITSPDHFWEPTHAAIFKNIAARAARDHLANATTVSVDLAEHEGLKELGGGAYLVRLMGGSISGSMVADYAQDLANIWQRRRLIEALDEAAKIVRVKHDVDEARGAVETAIASLPEVEGREISISSIKAMTETVAQINRAFQGEQVGVPTGFLRLDKRLGGFSKQNLVILAGRPSMGKSALALSLATRAAAAGRFVAIVSLEMSQTEIMERVIAERTRVDYERMRRTDGLTPSDMDRIVETARDSADLPLWIVPPHVRDIAAIHAALKQIQKRQGRLDLVVVDYLQLIRGKGNSPNERVSDVTMGLKALAKVFDVPVIALSQLSRGVENRDDKRPMLSDLRDSGSIEQDADVVMFCYREEYYLRRQTPPSDAAKRADYEADMAASKNQMEIITAKQRMGSIGVDLVGCHLPTNRFWDLEGGEEFQ